VVGGLSGTAADGPERAVPAVGNGTDGGLMRGGGNTVGVRAVRQIDRTPAYQSEILRRQDIVPERRMARGTPAPQAAGSRATAAMVGDGAHRLWRGDFLA
jgi:hypothetical protein